MVMGESAVVVGGGLAAGIALSILASRWIESRLYGVPPDDPIALGGAVGLLLAVAFAAAFPPARRASRIDPLALLRKG
jgi:ABC-type antimicrobial peptide transport system permease subunit